MKVHPYSELRRQRLREMISIIESSGPDGITTGKLRSIFSLKYGTQKSTLYEYLQDVKDAEVVLTDGQKWYGKEEAPKRVLENYLQAQYITPIEKPS